MNLLLRNVDVVAVKKIDQLAKAKKMSRNEFLKIEIERLSQFDMYEKERERFEKSVQTVAETLGQTMRMIQEQQEELLKMKATFMLVADIDEEEMETFIDDFILKKGVPE